jgi:transcriptional regulator with PAS, ATPase and Fis domain
MSTKDQEKRELVWMKARDVGILGQSDELYHALEKALNAAPTEVSVLILGANGTGKEQMARLIHEYSRASGKQFLAINCASIAPNLFESEMFGHEKGAFTGANATKKGAFELAHGGTLFLDELGEMPLEQQAKLLRVMQTGRCRRLGSSSHNDNIEARPRIIAATNVDIEAALQNGKLREDLFYRMTRRVELPPLSGRRSDIAILAHSFLEHFVKEYGSVRKNTPKSISPQALKRLENHDWPGNIRELRSVIENAFIDARGKTIEECDLTIFSRREESSCSGTPELHEGFDSKTYLEGVRDQLYLRALEMNANNLSAAARCLGISKQSLAQWKDKRS